MWMENKILSQRNFILLIVIFIQSSMVFGVSLSDYNKDKKDFNKTSTTPSDKVSHIASYFDVGATLTQVEATCANNGSITAVATGSTSTPSLYVFKITNGPTANGQTYPTPDQFNESTLTFNDLYPGVYQITIEDAGDTSNPIFIQNITVIDNTEVLDFSMSSTVPNCPNIDTGSITVTTSSGAGPYQYQIINGPSGTLTAPIDNASTTHVFNNLPSGNYSVRVFDACGDFQTRNHTVDPSPVPGVFLFEDDVNRISCTDAIYSVSTSGPTGANYTYEIVGGAPAGYASTNTTGSFTLPIDQAPYTISVVSDGCMQTDTRTVNNNIPGVDFGFANIECTDFDLQLTPNNWMIGPFTFTLTSTPVGYVGPLTNTTGIFSNVPYGNYDYTVSADCGVTISGSRLAESEPLEITGVAVDPDSCREGFGRLTVWYNQNTAVDPVSFELTSTPPGFAGNPGPQNSNVFNDAVVGNYVITATDACGNSDSFPYEFREEDAFDLEFNINVIPGCINEHDLTFTVSESTNGTFRFFRLIEVSTGSSIAETGSFSGPGFLFNLPPGEYYLQYDNFAGCIVDSDNFIIEPYQQPKLTPLSSYVCVDEAFVTISGITEGGFGPYTYSLINNANNQVIATSNECYFSNQDAFLNYRVRIEDNCGNSSSAQVTPVGLGLGLEFQGDTCAPIGDPFSVYLKEYIGVNYNWTFPDGTTFNGSDPREAIGIITSSDYGLYTIAAATADGCRTQNLTLDFDACPPPSIDFDGVNDYISAPSSFNISDMEELTIQFWVKANSASQVAGGIVGQRGVLEVSKDASLGYNFIAQGNAGEYSKQVWLDDADTWQHISIVYNAGEIKTYYNGYLDNVQPSIGVTRTAISDNLFNIGGRIGALGDSGYFHGWIDEVRVFDKALTDTQIQQIIYQEIENNNGNVRGAVIPKDVKDFTTGEPLLWSNLKLYYRMGTTFTEDGRVIDYSGNENHGTIFNIRTWQEETAPMPYVTLQDGNWNNKSTWLHGDVWDIPSSTVFNTVEGTNVENNELSTSSIVQISHNVTVNHNVEGLTQMGLIIDNGNTLTITEEKFLENQLYLDLSGTIDLLGDSQLIQTSTSDLVTSSEGKVLRRQEGTSSAYWYNYWASPVGALAARGLTDNNAATNNLNNTPFNIGMLKDETGANYQFTSGYTANGNISTYWLFTFRNGRTYWDWASLSTTTPIEPGVGYTQKGTGTAAPEQQYIFEGRPNNGTILVDVSDVGGPGSVADVSKTEYLLGNPYPSAIDIHKFIDDNVGVIDGYLQLWQQWSGTSHNLNEYNGGYSQVNKTGFIRAKQFVGLSGETIGDIIGLHTPTRYLPVGQAFIAEIVVPNGQVEFNNSQRIFIKESDADGTYDNGSAFSKPSADKASIKEALRNTKERPMQKIRLELNAIAGPETKRELLLGFSEKTTDGYDYGYEAKNTDLSNNDLNLDFEGQDMNIQAYAPISDDKLIPLNFKSSGDNVFEISITDLEYIDRDQPIYLRDQFNNVYFDLRQGLAYKFSSEQGVFNERFQIVFQTESKTLSTDTSSITDNYMFYQNTTNTFFAKKLNSTVSKLSVVNMRGQVVLERVNLSREQLESGIQFSNIATGAYIVSLRTETNEVLNKKIIVH